MVVGMVGFRRAPGLLVRYTRREMLCIATVAESAPTIGIALAPPEKDSDTIPVFVTLR